MGELAELVKETPSFTLEDDQVLMRLQDFEGKLENVKNFIICLLRANERDRGYVMKMN